MTHNAFHINFGCRKPKQVTREPLLKETRHNPLLWLLALVPIALIAAKLAPTAHTLLFTFSVLAIVPLAALLSHATESVAEKTGDTVGGLLNATLGNLTELVIATAALRAGEYELVKGSIAGTIVTNTLFMVALAVLLVVGYGLGLLFSLKTHREIFAGAEHAEELVLLSYVIGP